MTDVWIIERQYRVMVGELPASFAVHWAKPEADPRGDWKCAYRIDWPHKRAVRRHAYGVDSTQALYLAMMNVASELYTSETAVHWWEPDDVLGLPVALAIADLEAARTKGRS